MAFGSSSRDCRQGQFHISHSISHRNQCDPYLLVSHLLPVPCHILGHRWWYLLSPHSLEPYQLPNPHWLVSIFRWQHRRMRVLEIAWPSKTREIPWRKSMDRFQLLVLLVGSTLKHLHIARNYSSCITHNFLKINSMQRFNLIN